MLCMAAGALAFHLFLPLLLICYYYFLHLSYSFLLITLALSSLVENAPCRITFLSFLTVFTSHRVTT